jgi:hypothetical protein
MVGTAGLTFAARRANQFCFFRHDREFQSGPRFYNGFFRRRKGPDLTAAKNKIRSNLGFQPRKERLHPVEVEPPSKREVRKTSRFSLLVLLLLFLCGISSPFSNPKILEEFTGHMANKKRGEGKPVQQRVIM